MPSCIVARRPFGPVSMTHIQNLALTQPQEFQNGNGYIQVAACAVTLYGMTRTSEERPAGGQQIASHKDAITVP